MFLCTWRTRGILTEKTGTCQIRSWDNCKSIWGDAKRKPEGEAKNGQYCKWTLCEHWWLQRKVYRLWERLSFLSKRRYWEKLPLGHLSEWFLSACPPSCSISGLYMQVPEGSSTPWFRSLLRVLNNLVIDCFLASLAIACNVKCWKRMEEYHHTYWIIVKPFFAVS